jgi:hypothetical protein
VQSGCVDDENKLENSTHPTKLFLNGDGAAVAGAVVAASHGQ